MIYPALKQIKVDKLSREAIRYVTTQSIYSVYIKTSTWILYRRSFKYLLMNNTSVRSAYKLAIEKWQRTFEYADSEQSSVDQFNYLKARLLVSATNLNVTDSYPFTIYLYLAIFPDIQSLRLVVRESAIHAVMQS